MGSCVSTLRRIQHDVGITDKELKQAVREVCTPKQVKLPVLREKTTPQQKMQQKVSKKSRRKMKLRWVQWYLEEYLRPEYAAKIYMKYETLKELVEEVYKEVLWLVQLLTFQSDQPSDLKRAFPGKPQDDLDIQDEYWKAFGMYCKKHPLKSVRDIWKRRRKFRKWVAKRRYSRYSPKRLRIYDPFYAATALDEKEMLENIERIGKENEIRIQKFHEMLDELVKDQSIGAVAMKQFSKQTDELMKQHRKRLNEFIKRTGRSKPTPIQFDFDDQSILYDDWENPDSIDSVFNVPIKDL